MTPFDINIAEVGQVAEEEPTTLSDMNHALERIAAVLRLGVKHNGKWRRLTSAEHTAKAFTCSPGNMVAIAKTSNTQAAGF